ncbi:MAG: recombination protein RecR [Candidatus Azambacteria bacterium GW2011_GWA2_42_9]|uniref:Recombination protein RecR n=4 Tax=Candidatus Azamiibacteriota TaxID=1752741 RepID=A0A0G0ZBT3_9BACT|nr:MAG: recombination protein RecR [Candidatus Azambacteria bacterium GW2011_GWB1_42_17]KKS46099.1 MAG: recombination protein RecR [Candidatus Azambacteria bacterium GW2011_GWA1_42_19]KKS75333.1 MAG: recombination protein RecR [Candidatus Azambacteria bacterium GW2011_GWA2_42_9]KKS88278.1 MAG: recombination protein RecR [Parcubacteria group bacterium GW2011_GWC1_43_11]
MYPKPIKEFIDKFAKLPGIGPRQAARLAFWLLNGPKETRQNLKRVLEGLDKDARTCGLCHYVIENDGNDKCHFCDNPSRDHKTICVVEKETDLATIERSGTYKGLYHVLGGLFSALDTAVPKHLKLPELINRIENRKKETEEVILALSPTHEGDLTAHYLERLLKPSKVKITRLGRGLPYGSDVEFADAQTLSGALESRKEIK